MVAHLWGLAMQQVEFFFGLGSRYSYLAFTQVVRIEALYSCTFSLQPIGSGELLNLRGASPFRGAPLSGQYEWDYRRRDAVAWAEYYRVPFVEPKSLPEDHRLMARACHAAGMQGALRPYCQAMFQAVFVSSEDINEQTCAVIASRIKLDVRAFSAAIGSGVVNERVTASARRAFERGAFGVPTFFVGDRMFWGNDRLVLLEHYLAQQGRR
jgi:2-hydroxychromene-2-carboxylate isomerase